MNVWSRPKTPMKYPSSKIVLPRGQDLVPEVDDVILSYDHGCEVGGRYPTLKSLDGGLAAPDTPRSW